MLHQRGGISLATLRITATAGTYRGQRIAQLVRERRQELILALAMLRRRLPPSV